MNSKHMGRSCGTNVPGVLRNSGDIMGGVEWAKESIEETDQGGREGSWTTEEGPSLSSK